MDTLIELIVEILSELSFPVYKGTTMSRAFKFWLWVMVVLVLLGGCAVIGRVAFVDHVESHELGYRVDMRTGAISRLPRFGYFITPPLIVKVHTIDLRPVQICMSANKRVSNCKLVSFNPAGLDEFLSWHGRGNYQTILPQSGTQDLDLADILKAYAYEEKGVQYSFLNSKDMSNKGDGAAP